MYKFQLIFFSLIIFSNVSAQNGFQLTDDFAHEFAEEWISSWNSHDIDRILEHYQEDFVMSSPSIRALGLNSSGTIQGKDAMRGYWGRSLGPESKLKMELHSVLVGANGLTIYYHSVHRNTMAAEVFVFGDQGLVSQSSAHYLIEE